MLKRYRFFAAATIALLCIQSLLPTSLFAQTISSFNIRDIVAGQVPNIQVQAVGSRLSNLGLILRFSTTRTDSFDVLIPAGTHFILDPGGVSRTLSSAIAGPQSFFAALSQRNRFPGGGRTIPPQILSSYTQDIFIYALCFDVSLPPPDTTALYRLSVDSLESIPRINKMLKAFVSFETKMKQIDEKINAKQTLTDDETRYAAFIDWIEEPGLSSQSLRLKGGTFLDMFSSRLRMDAEIPIQYQTLQKITPEIRRDDAQSVVWTMVPDDQNFSPEKVRSDIGVALHITSKDTLDNFMRRANSFLELLGLERRLLVLDSLRVPIAHDIFYPPFFIISWNGPGGGFAVRMTPPQSSAAGKSKWQILDVSYFIQSPSGGSFRAAILSNVNGSPGNDLTNRRTVSFPTLPNGGLVTVDLTNDNIVVDGEFFVTLFQTTANNPNVILSEAINGRAHGFNGVGWSPEAFSLFFRATVKKVSVTDVESSANNLPISFALHPNYPNPFNPTTAIRFDIPRPTHVTITISNLLGQQVATPIDQRLEVGRHVTIWNGTTINGSQSASGVYLVRMQAEDFVMVRKITLIR